MICNALQGIINELSNVLAKYLDKLTAKPL